MPSAFAANNLPFPGSLPPSSNASFPTRRPALRIWGPSAGATVSSAGGAATPANLTGSLTDRMFSAAGNASGITG